MSLTSDFDDYSETMSDDGETIKYVSLQYSRYMPIPIVVLGFIGNVFNIVIFTRRPMNTNPCSIYFLSSSAANLSVLFFGSIFRCLADGFAIDVSIMHIVVCRVRYYILHCSMVLSPWIVVLAGIDRFCVSSPHIYRRRLSTRRHAKYSVIVATILCSLLFSHSLLFFEIEQLPSGPNCYAQTGPYRVFYDILYFTTYSVVPPILMVIVGVATLHNLHQSRLQVRPKNSTRRHPFVLRKKDRQLIRMLLMQFLVVVICTLPIALQKLYLTFTQNMIKSAYESAVEAFAVQITRQLAFANSCLSFFV